MSQKLILGIIVAVVVIGGLGYWGYRVNTSISGGAGPQVSGATDETPIYFSDSAQVMYFYQDTCTWCIKEKDVLNQLGAQGYRVKPMNIGSNHPENQSFWKDYNISGTPTFVANNKDHLDGYQNIDTLKAFLDQHK
jgi:hypothetical protein